MTAVISSSAYLFIFNPMEFLSERIVTQEVEKNQMENAISGLESELHVLRHQLDMQRLSDLPGLADHEPKLRKATLRKRFVALSGRQPFIAAVATSANNPFNLEIADPWANRTESQLIHRFDQLNLKGSYLLNAECQSSFCRIEVYHEDNRAKQSFISGFAHPVSVSDDNKYGFYRTFTDNEGNRRTLFFYARKGYDLPNKESQ